MTMVEFHEEIDIAVRTGRPLELRSENQWSPNVVRAAKVSQRDAVNDKAGMKNAFLRVIARRVAGVMSPSENTKKG